MSNCVYDVWLKYYLREIYYGINEDYSLLEYYVRDEGVWKKLEKILCNEENKLFVHPKETSKIIVKMAKEYIKPKNFLGYYTSFETACSLIKNEELWLTSSEQMNDYGEIEFGFKKFWEKFKLEAEAYDGLKKCAGIFANDTTNQVDVKYDTRLTDILSNVCFTCFSEFNKSDLDGKLSMWRKKNGLQKGNRLELKIQ